MNFVYGLLFEGIRWNAFAGPLPGPLGEAFKGSLLRE